MNRTDRLVSMVMYLQGRRLVRAQELATHFEINVRTVYRDIAALAESGVPICGEAGVGYSLLKGYHLPPVTFTAEEATALFMGGEMLKRYSDASMRAPAESAMLKIRSVLPQDRQDELDRMAAVTLIGSPWGLGNKQRSLLPVQKALVDRRVLRMSYRAAQKSETTLRDVEPLGVVFSGSVWYLIAWCRLRKEMRHFRLDRIHELTLLAETFLPRENFSLKQHLENSNACAVTHEIRLRVKTQALERVRKESYTEIVPLRMQGDHTELSLRAYSLEWMARWALSFGPDMEVLSPPHLRELITRFAVEILTGYGQMEQINAARIGRGVPSS